MSNVNERSAAASTLARHGGLSYIEIPAIDVQRSATFYEEVFDWQIGGDADHPKFADADGRLIGKWIEGRTIAKEPGLLPYFYVDSVDEAIEQILEFGGLVVTPPYAEGDLRVARVSDPAGNVLGVWQEAD